MIDRVVLIGLSGVGKSTTARLIGRQLDWEVVDLDQRIEAEAGRSIPELFRSEGEEYFRGLEARVFRDALARSNVVIATGGGAVLNPDIWDASGLGNHRTLSVWLDATTDRLVERLRIQAVKDGGKAERPLLQGDPVSTINLMRERRSPIYARASIAFDVTEREPAMVAADIVMLVALAKREPVVLNLMVEKAVSHIQIGPGVSMKLEEAIHGGWPNAQQVFVACDAGVMSHLGPTFESLEQALGRPVHWHEVASGESSKSVADLAALWDWMLGHSVQRGDLLVAIGGGVVGDLAGFAAATVLRGIGLLQIPTTLLSMVDSSVGGKTAINHAAGKNLIGAFHQAQSVLIDSMLLRTLPERECRSGWGEIIKHAVIEASTPGGTPPVLLGVLERNHRALLALEEPLLSWVISRNVAIKAAVVAADEREAGIRAYLNFGHTIGHGIEAAGYSLLHGEAVAVGMSAALEIATQMKLVDSSYATRVRDLIETFGLPLTAAVDPGEVLRKMASDKKKSRGRQTWVLPDTSGGVELRSDVPEDVIWHALELVTRTG